MSDEPETPEPTAQENAAGKVAVEQWNEYVGRWHQPIMKWAEGVRKDSADQEARATGITNADLAQQTAGAERRMGAGGMNPNSGKGFGALSAEEEVSSSAGSSAAVKARQGVEDARLFGMQQVANIGMGQKTEAVQGIQEIAQDSVTDSLNKAVDRQNRHANNVNLASGMAGVAAGIGVDQYRQNKMQPYTDTQGGQYQQSRSGVRVKSVQ